MQPPPQWLIIEYAGKYEKKKYGQIIDTNNLSYFT
jgi:hypothetical protein